MSKWKKSVETVEKRKELTNIADEQRDVNEDQSLNCSCSRDAMMFIVNINKFLLCM